MPEGRSQFDGHLSPKANWTWVPIEFFDVVLRTASLAQVRLVACLLRHARGQETEDWLPQDAHLSVSYGEFVRSGVHRSLVRSTLDACEATGLISLVSAGRLGGATACAGIYSLRWSGKPKPVVSECGKRLPDGFCGSIQTQVAVPNTFLDHTVRECSLRVIQVVAAFVLRCLGYTAVDGVRRREVALSTSQIRVVSGIASMRKCVMAIDEAIASGHLRMLVKPHFATSRSAIYAIRWADGWGETSDPVAPASGSLPPATSATVPDATLPTDSSNASEPSPESVAPEQTSGAPAYYAGVFTGPLAAVDQVQSEQGASTKRAWGVVQNGQGGSADRAGGAGTDWAGEVVQNGHPLAFKALEAKQEPSSQQQHVVAEEEVVDESPTQAEALDPCSLVDELVRQAVDPRVARTLVEQYDTERILRQIRWAPMRGPAQNPAGRLVQAVRSDWPEPMRTLANDPVAAEVSDSAPADAMVFARSIYAGTAGVSADDSVAEPDTFDLRGVLRMLHALNSRYRHMERSVAEWGWALGAYAVAQRRQHEKSRSPLGLTASRIVAIYGDSFLSQIGKGQQRHFHRPQAQSTEPSPPRSENTIGAEAAADIVLAHRDHPTAKQILAVCAGRYSSPVVYTFGPHRISIRDQLISFFSADRPALGLAYAIRKSSQASDSAGALAVTPL